METLEIKKLFAEIEAEQANRAAKERSAPPDPLQLARDIAEDLARAGNGCCNADDVGKVLKDQYGIPTLGGAAGSIFRGKQWEFTGEWIKSVRKSNHNRMIREWRLT